MRDGQPTPFLEQSSEGVGFFVFAGQPSGFRRGAGGRRGVVTPLGIRMVLAAG